MFVYSKTFEMFTKIDIVLDMVHVTTISNWFKC